MMADRCNRPRRLASGIKAEGVLRHRQAASLSWALARLTASASFCGSQRDDSQKKSSESDRHELKLRAHATGEVLSGLTQA